MLFFCKQEKNLPKTEENVVLYILQEDILQEKKGGNMWSLFIEYY